MYASRGNLAKLNYLDIKQLLDRKAIENKRGTSEVQSKMIIMGHQISSCHVPVVKSFFIL
jgi:hypothetical protein